MEKNMENEMETGGVSYWGYTVWKSGLFINTVIAIIWVVVNMMVPLWVP